MTESQTKSGSTVICILKIQLCFHFQGQRIIPQSNIQGMDTGRHPSDTPHTGPLSQRTPWDAFESFTG
jgi:hypothetical protein